MKVKETLTKVYGKTKATVIKNSPEILIGVGIVSFAGTIVMACRATKKAETVLEKHNHMIDDAHMARELSVDEYGPEATCGDEDFDDYFSEEDEKNAVIGAYLHTAVGFAKLYAPTIGLAALSITCFLTSRNILAKRYLAAVTAYNGLYTAFDEYRHRVIEEQGEEVDRRFRYGASVKKGVPVVDENGKKTGEKMDIESIDQSKVMPSENCIFFDSSNPNWDKNPALSMMFLRGQLNYLNDKLHERGHLFLNEVYDALGYDRTPQGSLIGWIDEEGDGFVDFGLYDPNKEEVRRFVNGKSDVILLEFNHDGIIWDKL